MAGSQNSRQESPSLLLVWCLGSSSRCTQTVGAEGDTTCY